MESYPHLYSSLFFIGVVTTFLSPKSPLRISWADVSARGLVCRSLPLFVPLNPSELIDGPSLDVP